MKMVKEEEKESGRNKMKSFGSVRSIFMHADGVDWLLMGLGFIGAVGDGFTTPLVLLITSKLMNNLGGSSFNTDTFMQSISKNSVALLYVACGSWVVCFLEGYCWTRTGERQTARMREKYLRAVLRQDVGYFDLHVTSTSDVITSVSSDSFVIQDVLSEKLPNFLMSASAFVGSYIVGFVLLWRLAIVGLPFIVLLVIPGLMYGRALISISRKIREEYNEAGFVAEQAISSVRTVYAFSGERKTISKFSTALQGSVKLGIKQGLAKGITIGSNGITFAMWGFMSWYGSRMVMYHGAQGGTVFAVTAAIAIGGVSLGGGLSNLKYFFEAASVGERIMEVINRVPKIDSDNPDGHKLERIRGEVEFKNVKFVYPSRVETSIFDDFCLRVPSGKTVALVGGSGSGKSTVISLLQRFYDPLAGEILIDGISIDKLQVKWLRSQMGLVSQEPALFATTIKENILFGKEDASMDDVVEAAYAYSLGSMVSVYFLTSHDEIKEKTRIYALSFVGLAILSFLINISQHYNFAYMGEYLTKRIRERMLSKVLTFEVGWFDRDENSSGAICSRLAKDANVVRSLVGDRMALLVQTVSAVTIAFTMGLVIAWRLALVMIAVQPVIIVCFYTRRVLLKSMSKKAIKAQDESSKLAAEAVSNVRTITAFSSQERIMKMLEKAQESPRRESIRQSWFAGFGLAMSQSLTSCTWALDFWYGGRLIQDGYITAKALFETFMILVSTGRVIADAGSMTTDLAKGSDAVGSVFAVLDRYTSIDPEDPDGYQTERITGQVEFLDVDFSYPTRPDVIIFKNFSIKIEEGKSTAIVGPSGSGKSTIIGLIERFYDPLKGIVKIDGRDIRSYHLRSLRQHIALVSQEPTLFAGTIRENIIYGGAADKIDEAEIIEAAKAANAHDFITSLTEGYDTYCGDRGVQLSGGQKQRIAIARAVLKNPSVLLLDEATSALDSQSERVVQDALERVMVGRTSVVIAHRLSTIQNCDAIAVLDKGKLVERGTHSSLLSKGPTGIYFSLVSLQTTSG
ncbi:ABC transporter type 1 transmembrane domain [Arabidopsis suecica]|uniref:ABC transporter type 1 transmembrane domain n=1 Tax=Arabidopsis suecica TaxID=45249 RepID=A0A8T1ZVE8_ARASU|nr:ABC transporter type 1 transmembrane domain [Arabidopsis suecica]